MDMTPENYLELNCDFDWTTIEHYPNHTLAVRCDFAPDSSVATAIPAILELPANVTLQFEGGSFSDVNIVGNNTRILASLIRIFDTSVTLTGTFVYETFYPEWFGALQGDTTDDFKAFEATFNFANHVTLTQEYSIETNEQIVVSSNDFTLMGYGSIITNASDTHLMDPIFVFTHTDNLTIKGITIHGNSKIANALHINDIGNVTLEDITIKDLHFYHEVISGPEPDIVTDRVVGIRIDIKDPTNIYGNNIRISELSGGHNTTIGDPLGIARAIFCVVNHNNIETGPENTKVIFENSCFEWVYGDDGDIIHIVDQNYISDAKHRFIFDNCTIRYAFRRLVKGSASGIQYYNCKFDTASLEELKAKMGVTTLPPDIVPSGGVNFRNENPGEFEDFRNMHGKMINCEYRNSGNLSLGSGNVLIAAYTDGLELRGNRFYDMYVKFQNATANFIVDNNQFYNANIETNLIKGPEADPTALNEWEDGISYITNNYAYFRPAVNIHPALINVKNDLISVTIHNNRVFSEEGNTNLNFFGLLRHTRIYGTENKLVAQDVNICGNEITRTNSVRKEYLIVSDGATWQHRCRIFDNFINREGAGVGAKFVSGAIPPLPNFIWGNRDSDGNIIGIV